MSDIPKETTVEQPTSPQPPKIVVDTITGGPLDPNVDIVEYAEKQQARWKARAEAEKEQMRHPFKHRTVNGNKRTDF